MESRDRSLYYFTLVAEELNISAVSKKLFISQQALSKHIHRLEDDFGVQLFVREPRLQLTGEGQRVLSYAKRVLAEERGLRNSLIQDRMNTTRFPVGFAIDCGEVLIPSVFERFKYARPDITLAFSPCGYSDIMYLLKHERIKMSVGMLFAATKYCAQLPLFADDLYFIVQEELFWKMPEETQQCFLVAASTGISIDDIARSELPLIIPWRAGHIGNILMNRFHLSDSSPDIIAEAVSFGETVQLCAAGHGGAFAHRSQIYSNITRCISEKLYIFPINDLRENCMLGLIYNEGADNDPAILDFIQCAKEAAADVVNASGIALVKYQRVQVP